MPIKKIILSSVLSLFFLSGCTSTMLNNDYNKYSKEQYETIKKNKDTLKNDFKKNDSIVHLDYIDLTNSKDLSVVLNELGKLNSKLYMLDGKNDIKVYKNSNSKLIGIKNFFDLKKYIEDTSNYTIKVISNRYFKNKIKRVVVINKSAANAGFNNIKFRVKGKESISSALSRIGSLIGYSISFDKDLNSVVNDNNGLNRNVKDFRKQDVVFNGKSVSNFLDFISQNFNVYCDVEYDKKIITIKKYKTEIFNLIPLNYKTTTTSSSIGISTNTGGSSLVGNGGSPVGGTGDSAIQTVDMDIITTLKENLNSLLNDSNSKLIFSKESGTVMVRATKNNMQEIKNYINKINAIYSQQIEVTISIYEFVLNRNYNFGTDISGTSQDTTFGSNNLVNTILSINSNIGAGTQNLNIESNNKFMRYSKSYSYTQTFMNNTAKNLIIQTTKDYIKSRQATTTTNTATTTTTNTEISTVNDGIDIKIMPRIVGNKISLNINMKINSLNQLKEVSDGQGGSIFLPDQDTKEIPTQLIMTDGDRRLIGTYQSYQDEKTYNGVAPIEDFVIAGKSGKTFVKKEIFIVIETKIIKN